MVKYLRQSPFIFPCIYNGHNVFLIEQYLLSVSYPLLYTRAKIRASSMKLAQVWSLSLAGIYSGGKF